MTELAARDTGAKAVIADAYRLVLESICEVVLASGHSSDKNTDAFSCSQTLDVVPYPHEFGVEAKGDFTTIGRKMICYGVLDELEKLILGVSGSNGVFVKQLNHEPGKALKGARDANSRANFDQDILGCVNEDLELPCFVHGRVKESQEALSTVMISWSMKLGSSVDSKSHLVCDIWTSVADVTIHLPHYTNMLVTVEKRVFFIASSCPPTLRSPVRLKAGV